MPPNSIKIAVVGPLASGKSSFINLATENRETVSDHYIPTVPIRILEYEVPIASRGRQKTWNVQILDCSGDTKYENTWPAMSYKLNGTIFVFNPSDKKQAEELNLWYNNFVEKPNITEKSCLLVASRKMDNEDNGRSGPDVRLSTLFSDITRIDFNGKPDEVENLKQSLNDFLKKVVSEMSQTQDQD